jgi:c(7)-type cytochrome triheme protein
MSMTARVDECRQRSSRRCAARAGVLSGVAVLVLALGVTPFAGAEYADVILNKRAEKEGVRPVIFPHWFHRIRFRCKVCHHELGFEMRAGANDITMDEITDGKFCGMCHNGEIAWSVENCDLCHSGQPGLKSRIMGGHQTTGPGRW